MPEGAEVWILSEAINKFCQGKTQMYTISFGKHLLIYNTESNPDILLDWSFGLNGKVCINKDCVLTKVDSGWIHGDEVKCTKTDNVTFSLGADWITSPLAVLENLVTMKMKTSKKKLGALLLEQDIISGIGVAWGSEILYRAQLRPDMKASEQDLTHLALTMSQIRDEIKLTYLRYLASCENDLQQFINGWFNNLYAIRDMKIYKKGTQVVVNSRKWWVNKLT